MAGITFQQPFRFIIPADQLIGGGRERARAVQRARRRAPARAAAGAARDAVPPARPAHPPDPPAPADPSGRRPRRRPRHALTEQEELLGRDYWGRVAAARGDAALLTDARSWLAAQLDPYRALWVAAQFAPPPTFHSIKRRTAPRPTLARLLPARWLAIGYVNNEEVDRWWSLPVTADLPMAPNLAALEQGDGVRALLDRQGLRWMVDFQAAVDVGMGIEIPLDNVTAFQGFSHLIVVGVGDRPDDSAALAELLAAHRYTEGLDFVPQGSPTNNTETVASAVTPTLRTSTSCSRPSPPRSSRAAGRSSSEPAVLYRMRAANAASIALGLTAANALDRAPNAGLMESVARMR